MDNQSQEVMDSVEDGIVVDGLFVPKSAMYGIRRENMPWGKNDD